MGIVTQSTSICTIAIAPSGYLNTGIPLVQFLLVGRGSCVHSILRPVTHTELSAGAQQFILHQQHIEETLGILVKLLTGKAFVIGYGVLILLTSLISQGLTGDIYQIVLEVIITSIFLSHTVHQSGSLLGACRVVVVLHLRPA